MGDILEDEANIVILDKLYYFHIGSIIDILNHMPLHRFQI